MDPQEFAIQEYNRQRKIALCADVEAEIATSTTLRAVLERSKDIADYWVGEFCSASPTDVEQIAKIQANLIGYRNLDLIIALLLSEGRAAASGEDSGEQGTYAEDQAA